MNSFGTKIIELLDKNGMSQRELANSIGTTEVSVSRYINGTRIPKATVVANIAQVLNTTTDYLLTGGKAMDDRNLYLVPDENGIWHKADEIIEVDMNDIPGTLTKVRNRGWNDGVDETLAKVLDRMIDYMQFDDVVIDINMLKDELQAIGEKLQEQNQ